MKQDREIKKNKILTLPSEMTEEEKKLIPPGNELDVIILTWKGE